MQLESILQEAYYKIEVTQTTFTYKMYAVELDGVWKWQEIFSVGSK